MLIPLITIVLAWVAAAAALMARAGERAVRAGVRERERERAAGAVAVVILAKAAEVVVSVMVIQ